MPASLQTLIEQLKEVAQRNQAREALIARGPVAATALLAALDSDLELAHRKTILRTLLEIGDKRAEAAFRRLLSAYDEELRAIGARGLFLLQAPDALAAQLATINDAPDSLHFDITPAVTALSKMGLAVLPALLPLLAADDARTRQRAQRVLEQVTHNALAITQHEWRALWEANGAYRWDASAAARADSLQKWQRWIAAHLA